MTIELRPLQIEFINDENVKIFHAGTQTEKTFSLNELRYMVTFFLEYYHEGTTELSPLVLAFPQSEDECLSSPPQIEDKFKEYWGHRHELYRFIVEKGLLQIQFNVINEIKKVVPKSVMERIGDTYWNLYQKFSSLAEAKDPQLKQALNVNWVEMYLQAGEITINEYCKPFKELCVKLGVHSRDIRCFVCPLKTFCLGSEGWCAGNALTLLNTVEEQKKKVTRPISEIKMIASFLKEFGYNEYQRWRKEIVDRWV